MNIKTALTIASTDSSCGAGASCDLSVFRHFGVYGFMAIASVTSQNSGGLSQIFKVTPIALESQIDAVVKDFDVDACKIGMLYSHQAVKAVASRIKRRNIKNIVLDTPRISKNGRQIITEKAFKVLVKELLPLSDLVTPNIEEVYALCKLDVTDVSSAKEAAKVIFDMGVKNVLVKGGHLAVPIDILYDGKNFYEFPGEKYAAKRVHGTGCALSAAICANLAKGLDLPDAVSVSKDFLNQIILSSVRLGKSEMDFINI